MGMEQTVLLLGGSVPPWPVVHELLERHGLPVQLRMVDGELALPDETPADGWQELRCGTPQGMVTVRRGQDRVALVIWGNADAGLLRTWNALTWAFAKAGDGQIISPGGLVLANEFRRTADLPDGLRGEEPTPP